MQPEIPELGYTRQPSIFPPPFSICRTSRPFLWSSPRPILVVEDELGLEFVLRRLIHCVDPRAEVKWVTTQSEGQHQVNQVLAGHEAPYELVLIDLLLPNLEFGTKLWRYGKQTLNGARFAFMSSVDSDVYLKMFAKEESPPPFLRKPFRPSECPLLALLLILRSPFALRF